MRMLAPCIGIVTFVACTSWHAVEVAPAEYLRDNHPTVVQLIGSDSSRLNLRSPELRGDTIVGLSGTGSANSTAGQMRVSVSSVRGVEVERFSATKTTGLSLLLTYWLVRAVCSSSNAFIC